MRFVNEESFFVRHAYFLGANDPYKTLKTTLKAEIDKDAWETLHSDTSRPFEKPKSGRIAVKVLVFSVRTGRPAPSIRLRKRKGWHSKASSLSI